MSVKVMGLVWDYYPAGGDELLTALKVADHADHAGGNIWPSIASLAYLTRQSERTVQRHIKAMRTHGWLQVVEQGGKGPGSTTRYRIPVGLIPQGVAVRVTTSHPSPRVTPVASKGDKTSKKGDTAMSPEPSLEVQQQPSLIAEAPKGAPATGPANGKVVAHIPIIGGHDWPVTETYLHELEQAYPAVDGKQTLQEIRAWCISNPTLRKTPRGVMRFINSWFRREQDAPARRT